MSQYKLSIQEVVYSLSDALDLVGVTHIHHGKRVGYMAGEFGKVLGFSPEQMDNVLLAGILHDCGVSKTVIHTKLAQFEWENESEHCYIGAHLLESTPLLQHLSPIVKHHHTHWSVLKNLEIPEETKLAANCIYLADRVDILTLQYISDETDILLGIKAICDKILARKGDWFCPEVIDAFIKIARSEIFWFRLESEHVCDYFSLWLKKSKAKTITFIQLRELFHLFSWIVDAKSPFTKMHSDGVAKLARYIGFLSGQTRKTCEFLELAGLLHDIGKLRIPDTILEKPGILDERELAIMRRHSFDTYNVLKNIKGLEHVSEWAAFHHERLDGSGYPYHMEHESIPIGVRIIAIADVFQALAQRRPYREPLTPIQILDILKQQVGKGQLDNHLVEIIEANLMSCWEVAVGDKVLRL